MSKLTEYAANQIRQYQSTTDSLERAKAQVAPNYDVSARYIVRYIHNILQEYQIRTGQGPLDAKQIGALRALDFGCGVGRVMRGFVEAGVRHIDGADLSQNMLDFAKAEMKKAGGTSSFFLSSGYDCGAAPKNTYDILSSFLCMHHIPMRQTRLRIFEAMAECLRPKGMVFLEFKLYPGVGDDRVPRKHAAWKDNIVARRSNSACDVWVTPDSLGQVYQDLRLFFSDVCIRDIDSHADAAAYFDYNPDDVYPYQHNNIFVSASHSPTLAALLRSPV